ncbi:MAG TPA: tetratricopeptide repeat protein [Acidobacteriaceae bacterium]
MYLRCKYFAFFPVQVWMQLFCAFRFLSLIILLGTATEILWAAGLPPTDDSRCAKCHEAIYDSYQKTPMAHASGAATDGLLPGEFTHAASRVHYRLFLRDGRAWLSYDRPNAQPGHTLQGEQELEYFVGSGLRGRTYLFEKHGYWFESPVNWYSKQRVWDMNPKSLDAREMPFTLKVDSGCLHCHASAVQPAMAGANNHFAAQPFLHGGITCESCHGDPSTHLSSGGRGPILNATELPPSKRDSICLQCHLEGEISVNRVGRSLAAFVPGEDLSEYVVHFVRAGESGANGRATSQWEALLESECKKKSGDRLTCITCHDPHSSPAPEQRTLYFRNKCLTCHGQASFPSKHHPDQPDCVGCHMAREKTENVAHEQVTDHRIQRRPVSSLKRPAAQHDELVVVGGTPASDRDLGLAYSELAQRGDAQAGQEALLLLRRAERNERSRGEQADPDMHTALGFLAQMSGDRQSAMFEYQAALRANPLSSAAAGDLAILEARAGNVRTAVALLEMVSKTDPGEITASMDLATIECAIGNKQAAAKVLRDLLEFSPDNAKARQALTGIENGTERCGP